MAMEDSERERSHSLRKLDNTGSIRSARHVVLPVEDIEEDEEEEDEERRIGSIHANANVKTPDSPASSVDGDSDIDVPGGVQALRDPADTQPLMLSQREAEDVIARKKRVILHDIVKLGDVFWLYLALNCEF